jgi:hypothetical protein
MAAPQNNIIYNRCVVHYYRPTFLFFVQPINETSINEKLKVRRSHLYVQMGFFFKYF